MAFEITEQGSFVASSGPGPNPQERQHLEAGEKRKEKRRGDVFKRVRD